MATRAFLKICFPNLACGLQACVRLIAAITILGAGTVCFAQSVPRVALECPADVQHPFSPVELRVIVSWEGDAESHVIVPPEPVFPEGMTLRSSSFETVVSNSHYQLSYRFILAARRAGRFTIYPVSVLCWPRGSSSELSLLTNECTITVDPDVHMTQKKVLAIAAAVLLVLLAAVVSIIKKRTRRTRTHKQASVETDAGLVQQCRRERLQGDYEAFYTTARKAAHALMPADTDLHSRIAACLERAQFSSQKSSAVDADQILHQLERALNHTGQP
jgi:hypothetical protein